MSVGVKVIRKFRLLYDVTFGTPADGDVVTYDLPSDKLILAAPAAGGGPPTGPAGGDLSGTYPDPDIAANAVGSAEIAANAVGSSELADDAVDTAAIQNGAVTAAKVAADVATQAELDAVAAAAVNDGDAAGGVLDGTYPSPGLAAGVAGAGLAESANVLAVNVDDATVEISSDALRVKAGGIGSSHIATNAVGSDELANDAVDTAAIQAGAVTAAKVAADVATQAELDAVAAAAVNDGDTAGGVLSGTYPNPGFAVDMATQAELDALAAAAAASDAAVAAAAVNDGDAAGGVLDGTYPNPGLAAAVAGAGLAETTNVLSVNVDDVGIEISSDALRLKDDGVTAAKIAANAVGNSEMGDDAIGAAEIQDGVVAAVHMDSGAATLGQVPTADGAGNVTYEDQAGGGGSGEALQHAIAQTGHGFDVGDVVYHDGSEFVLAQADDVATAEVVGIVAVDTDADNFVLHFGGYIDTLSGLTAGDVYFLSETTPGLLTTTPPSAAGEVSKPLLVADSTTSGYFFNWRGMVVGGGMIAAEDVSVADADGLYVGVDVEAVLAELGSLLDGWIDDTANTWTRTADQTFTVAGDRTAEFSKGTRLRWTQTTVKYGVVVDSSHAAGTTTVTIATTTDYVLTAAAISLNYYSYMANPQGYPTWFNYTPALTASSVNPNTGTNPAFTGRFEITGRRATVFAKVTFGTGGSVAAGTGTYRISLPFIVAATQMSIVGGLGTFEDSSLGDEYAFTAYGIANQAYAQLYEAQTATTGFLTEANPVVPAASDVIALTIVVEI